MPSRHRHRLFSCALPLAFAVALSAGSLLVSAAALATPTPERTVDSAEPTLLRVNGAAAAGTAREGRSIRFADAGQRPRHDDAYRPDRVGGGYAPPRPIEHYPAIGRDDRRPYGDAYERYDRERVPERAGDDRAAGADRSGWDDDRTPVRSGGRAGDAHRPEYRPEHEDRDYADRARAGDDRRRIAPYDRDDVASLRRSGSPAAGYRDDGEFGEPYRPPYRDGRGQAYDTGDLPGHSDDFEAPGDGRTYTMSEIRGAGHRFFGSISGGLASVVEHAFRKAGRPNGYILGEDAGGAFIAGLRYGRGVLHTKNMGSFPVYWQGPSLGFDAGVEGSRVMVLVYNLVDPEEIYDRFAGVAGSAYVIGGVGLTFQGNERVTLAPIRAGVGLRLGANVGYLKYTRRPTWNPF